MSLVNQMLQDLQERKAGQSRPLTGLRAVPSSPAVAEPAPAKPWWIVAIAGIVSTIAISVWLGTLANDGDVAIPVSAAGAKVDAQLAIASQVAPEPVRAALQPDAVGQLAGFSGLKTNQLDYNLRFLPPARREIQEPVKPKSAATNPQPGPGIGNQSADLPNDPSESVIRTSVSPTPRLRREGLAALRAGRPIAAEQRFAALVAADPENAESHLLLHAALKAQSRAGAARAALVAGLERTAEPVQLARVLAVELLADGRINHALSVLNTHRPAGQTDLEYEALLAAVNQRAGNHDVAADLYGALVTRQPGNGTWWVGLAISQEANGLAEDAVKSFATATAAGTLDVALARYATERLDSLETGS